MGLTAPHIWLLLLFADLLWLPRFLVFAPLSWFLSLPNLIIRSINYTAGSGTLYPKLGMQVVEFGGTKQHNYGKIKASQGNEVAILWAMN